MKIALFIDQANLFASYKTMGHTVDFKKLITFLEKEFGGQMVFKNTYFAYPEEGTREYDVNGIHKLGTFLKKGLGFHVKKKALKRIEVRDEKGDPVIKDGKKIYREKGNLDVEIVMDVMQTWHHFDVMVLVSGDSDFEPLCRFLIWKGKKVYVLSTKGNVSSELINGSSKYYDISLIPEIFGNELRHRV